MIHGQSVPCCQRLAHWTASNPPESVLYAVTSLSANYFVAWSWRNNWSTCRCRKSGLELKRIAILSLSCTMGHGWLFTILWPRKFVRVYYVFVFFTVVYTELDIACSCWCCYCPVPPVPPAAAAGLSFGDGLNIMPIPSCTCLVLHNDVWPTFCC